MKITQFLVIGRTGIKSTRKTKPSLGPNEVCCRIMMELPDELFQRPHIEATLKIDKDTITPQKLTAEMVVNTKELIEQQTGMKVDLKVISIESEPEPKPDDAPNYMGGKDYTEEENEDRSTNK